MVELLENRLNVLDDNVVSNVKSALTKPHINPKEIWREMPYLKDDLVIRVNERLLTDYDFSQNLYSVVNKDVLKRVYYGILSTGDVPEEFLQSLTPWERVYFFRGRWTIRNPNLRDEIDVLTSTHLYTGLNKLHEDHHVRKAQGEYISEKKFPESDRVREDYRRIVIRSKDVKDQLGIPEKRKIDDIDLFR